MHVLTNWTFGFWCLSTVQLQPGVLDLLHYIAERGLNRAVITRNSWIAANNFLDKLKAELSTNQEQFPHLQSDAIFSQVRIRITIQWNLRERTPFE